MEDLWKTRWKIEVLAFTMGSVGSACSIVLFMGMKSLDRKINGNVFLKVCLVDELHQSARHGLGPQRDREKDRILVWRRLTVRKGEMRLVLSGCGFKVDDSLEGRWGEQD